MSRRSSRRRGQLPNHDEIINTSTDNNIIHHKRYDFQPATAQDAADISRRRELENLKFASGIQPSCTDFGPQREHNYPGYLFCKGCKEWDDRPRENKRAKRSQNRYKCTAGHTSFLHPTTRSTDWMPSKLRKREDEEELFSNSTINDEHMEGTQEIENELFRDPERVTRTPDTVQEIDALKAQIEDLEREVMILNSMHTQGQEKIKKLQNDKNALNNTIHRMKRELEVLKMQKPASVREGVLSAIDSVVKTFFRRLSPKRIGKEISDACWEYRDGVAKFSIMQKARKYLREHVFTPHAILRKLDIAGGICNLKAYMVLVGVERDSKDPLCEYGRDTTILPHEWRIRQASKLANDYADTILKMKHYQTMHGECVEFEDIIKFTRILFQAFGLDEPATCRSIDIALTLDGSHLTKHLAFVMAGIKMVDCLLKNPLTGNFDLNPDQDEKDYNIQSRRWSFPFKFCMGKETDAMYREEFSEIFEVFNNASKPGQTIFEGWEPLNFANPADMAAIQKMLGIGGACKVKTFFVIAAP